MTTDVVAEAIADIERRLALIDDVANKNLYLYKQEELLDFSKKVRTPCVGVVYVGMTLNTEGTRRERAHDLVCDLFMVGGELCGSQIAGIKSTSTELLAEMRDAMRPVVSETDKKWMFVNELPIGLKYADGTDLLCYVQRWSTIVLIS